MTPADRALRLHRALDYPYGWPGACYLYREGGAHPVDSREDRRRGCTPVLACGSNRSPEQLSRKFGPLSDADAILVEACRLDGFDVVHSAHITRYGAIPAALHPAPGVTVAVAVTWLSPPQLEIMDRSESVGLNYDRLRIGADVTLADGTVIAHAEVYRSIRGPLQVGGAVVAHADVTALGRRAPALRSPDLLRRAHAAFAPGVALETFVLRLGRDRGYRMALTRRLQRGL